MKNKNLLRIIIALPFVFILLLWLSVQNEDTYRVHTVCNGSDKTKGIDVSHHQGLIDWNRVKGDGVDFAFVRVSDSLTKLDSKFEINWVGAKSAGIIRGPYQFFRPNQDPELQALLFVSTLDSVGGLNYDDLPPVIDVEVDGKMSNSEVIASISIWIKYIEEKTNRTPIIYTGPSFWDSNNLGNGFVDYPLWIAHYTTKPCPWAPDAWNSWDFWQYTGSGYVDGVNGIVDINVFAGNKEGLWNFIKRSNIGVDAHTDADFDAFDTEIEENEVDAGVEDGFVFELDSSFDAVSVTDSFVVEAGEETDNYKPGCSCSFVGK